MVSTKPLMMLIHMSSCVILCGVKPQFHVLTLWPWRGHIAVLVFLSIKQDLLNRVVEGIQWDSLRMDWAQSNLVRAKWVLVMDKLSLGCDYGVWINGAAFLSRVFRNAASSRYAQGVFYDFHRIGDFISSISCEEGHNGQSTPVTTRVNVEEFLMADSLGAPCLSCWLFCFQNLACTRCTVSIC